LQKTHIKIANKKDAHVCQLHYLQNFIQIKYKKMENQTKRQKQIEFSEKIALISGVLFILTVIFLMFL
jgi:CHASE3 domain sensor protein